MTGRLEGKIALVTGAGSGIGAACARRFVDEGARVAGIDVKVPDAHPCSAFVAEDVRDSAGVNEAVAGIVSHLGPVDLLVNAAGVSSFGTADTIDEAEWDRVLDINLKGTWIVARAVLPGMVAKGGGSIVNLASVEGIEGGQSQTAYNASKGGVVLLTRSMAVDYGPHNVRVNCLCPGMIQTPMTAPLQDSGLRPVLEWFEAQHLLGRCGQPEEVAAAALFLASDDASFVTGHALAVDGGYLAGRRYPGTL
jgi:meso-butanediol dehydrogenase / (S,S)-butanediol dehydrogenase / diacetyl reductase